jgi:hypothetical protein
MQSQTFVPARRYIPRVFSIRSLGYFQPPHDKFRVTPSQVGSARGTRDTWPTKFSRDLKVHLKHGLRPVMMGADFFKQQSNSEDFRTNWQGYCIHVGHNSVSLLLRTNSTSEKKITMQSFSDGHHDMTSRTGHDTIRTGKLSRDEVVGYAKCYQTLRIISLDTGASISVYKLIYWKYGGKNEGYSHRYRYVASILRRSDDIWKLGTSPTRLTYLLTSRRMELLAVIPLYSSYEFRRVSFSYVARHVARS